MNPILTYCESHAADLIETTETLVRLESPSTDKAAVDRCGRELVSRLRRAGAAVETISQEHAGDQVLARFDGEGPPVLLLGHFDTVWPLGTLERMPLRTQDDRLHGPGTFDMKAGIAIGVTALQALDACGVRRPAVEMLLTTDEEIGSQRSRELIEQAGRRARAVLVLEPALPGGALKTARKGCGEYEVTVHGIAAHAGVDPGKGASAIHELATLIRQLEGIQDLERGVSVNVGVVSGGTRPNVVAEEARAIVDVRAPTRAEAARIEGVFRELKPVRPGTRLTIRGGFERPPLERSAAVVHLFELAAEVASSLGRTLAEGVTGGGSDGNFTAAIGAPTLDGLGPVGDGAHASHEHVVVSMLPWRAALVAGLIHRLAASA